MLAPGRKTINLFCLFFIRFHFIEGSFDKEKQQRNFHGMEVKLLGYQVSDEEINRIFTKRF